MNNLKQSLQRAVPQWMPRLAFAPQGQAPRGDVLICVFQRGGMDGLNALVPMGDADYYRARPNIAIAEAKPGDDKTAISLDGFFGLHPALAPLKIIWDAGQLAPVHAVGSPDPTHSHFDAMDTMERGTGSRGELGAKSLGTGWLGRHLMTLNNGNTSPLRAVGMGDMLQAALRGPVPATALKSIADFHLKGKVRGGANEIAKVQQTLGALYAIPMDIPVPIPNSTSTPSTLPTNLVRAGKQIEDVFGLLAKINVTQYAPANNAHYPEGDFGLGLMQIAQLIKAEVGLEVACIDIGGWDTHANEDAQLNPLLAEFGGGLAALWADLGDKTKNVTIVTMSEFGRRVGENGSGGTDHGHANAMFLMGGGVVGGKVHGVWPGLASDKLDGPGDLALTTDYRDVLSEILQKRTGNTATDQVFPGYVAKLPGVMQEKV